MKRISIRLWVQMLLLIGITLGLLWFFQIVMLERYYLYSQIRNIKQEGLALAKAYEEGESYDSLERGAEELNLKYNAGVEIYSISGERAFGYSIMPMLMGRVAYKQEIFNETAKGGIVVRQVKHNRLNSNILLVGIPAGEPGSLKGVIIISSPSAAIKETKGIIKEQLIIITAILVLISMLLTYYFSRAFTKPILEINEAAAMMAEGNLSVKVGVKSRDELGMLAETINDLSGQLQKIEQLRKDLIANVSHEFRTPLSLIKGYAETIRDVTGEAPEKRNRQLEIILEETDRLKRMVDDTLSMAQMQSDNFRLKVKPFDIFAAGRSIADRFSHMAEKKGITLEVPGDGRNIAVLGDEQQIEQVLYNLVNNSFDHTPPGGWVRVKVIENKNNIEIRVSDNGVGIPAEDLQYVWDRFYKVSKDGKGTGLGLSIAKGILESHGASYGAGSKPGEETEFWFTLEKA